MNYKTWVVKDKDYAMMPTKPEAPVQRIRQTTNAVDSINATINNAEPTQRVPSDQHQENKGLTLTEPKLWWATPSLL
jgi:hypothetical protein